MQENFASLINSPYKAANNAFDYFPIQKEKQNQSPVSYPENYEYAKGITQNCYSSYLINPKTDTEDKENKKNALIARIIENRLRKEAENPSEGFSLEEYRGLLNSLDIEELESISKADSIFQTCERLAGNRNPMSRTNRQRYNRLMQLNNPKASAFARELDRNNPYMSDAQFDSELLRRGIKWDYYNKR